MQRITEKQLESLTEWINTLTNSPQEPWTRDENGFRSNIGNYHLSHAYGGVCLHRMSNESGGVSTPIVHGHVTKRELFNAMHAYIRGLEQAKQEATK